MLLKQTEHKCFRLISRKIHANVYIAVGIKESDTHKLHFAHVRIKFYY